MRWSKAIWRDHEEPSRAARPDPPIVILADPGDRRERYFRCVVDADQTVAFQAEKSPVRPDPECVSAILVDGADETVRQSLRRAEIAEHAVLIAHQSATLGADPQRAFVCHAQRKNAVVR